MKKLVNLIYFSLVFFAGLFFTRALLPALLAALFFLLATFLFEPFWRFKQLPTFLHFSKSTAKLLIPAVLSLSFYCLVYLPLEFLITEYWLLVPKVSPAYGLFFLFFLVIVLNFFSWDRLLVSKHSRLLLLVFVTICGSVYFQYRREKLSREYLPKIYRISPAWGIQATLIEIEGINFYPAWREGTVILDDQELVVKFWSDKLITAEQQVLARFGLGELSVKREDGVLSNSVPFEIKNPADLVNLQKI